MIETDGCTYSIAGAAGILAWHRALVRAVYGERQVEPAPPRPEEDGGRYDVIPLSQADLVLLLWERAVARARDGCRPAMGNWLDYDREIEILRQRHYDARGYARRLRRA